MKNIMSFFGSICLTSLMTVCLISTSAADDPDKLPTATSVLKKYADACGGAAKLKSIKTLEMSGTLSLAGVDGTVNIAIQSKPSKIVTKAVLGQFGTQMQGTDGNIGWESSTMTGPRIVEGKELDQLVDEANMLTRIYDSENYFKEIKVVGMDEKGGEKCYKLKLTQKNGQVSTEYYSLKTGMMVSAENTVIAQGGTIGVETMIEEYKEFEGVKLPSKIMTQYSNGMAVKIVLNDFKVNPDLKDDKFAIPDDIQTLVEQQDKK